MFLLSLMVGMLVVLVVVDCVVVCVWWGGGEFVTVVNGRNLVAYDGGDVVYYCCY